MNDRGFTILEALVAIALIAVILGLVTETVLETRAVTEQGERRGSTMGDIVRALTLSQRGISAIDFSGDGIFESNRLQVRMTGAAGPERMRVENKPSGRCVITINDRTVHAFRGTATFQYLDKDIWRDTMPPDTEPSAVAMRLFHTDDPSGDPWELVVNTPRAFPGVNRTATGRSVEEGSGL